MTASASTPDPGGSESVALPRQPLVTVSASYGAGGSLVGPEVARRLGVPFFDRAIPLEVSRRLAVPLEAALAHEEHAPGPLARLLASFAPIAALYGAAEVTPPPDVLDENTYRAEADRVIRGLAAHGGGVLLGRAAAIVLSGHPYALHVRLDGPAPARIARAMERQAIDEQSATQAQRETDAAREAYVRGIYRTDPHDAALYHLNIDSTAVSVSACVELIVNAAQARMQPGE